MEQALKNLLSGVIGEKLLDSAGLQLLQEVNSLKEKDYQTKISLQKAAQEQQQLQKDVSLMQEMLSLLQDLTRTFKNDVKIDNQIERDMTWQIKNHLRSKHFEENVFAEIENTVDYLQHKILLREKETQKLERSITMDADLLQDLLLNIGTNDESNLLILKLTAQDSAEIKKYGIELEKLSNEVAKAECHYRHMKNESNACKTSQVHLMSSFLVESQRRDDLLLMWEQTLDKLKAKNDQEIFTMEETNVLLSKIASLRQIRNDEDYLLKQIQSSVQEIQSILEDVEKDAECLSLKIVGVVEALHEINSQVIELTTCQSKSQSELQQVNQQIKNILNLYKEKMSFLKRLETKCSKLEAELLLESELLFSTEQSLRSLETIRTECEKQNVVLEKQIIYIQHLKQKHQNEQIELDERDRTEKGLVGALMATRNRTQKDIRTLKQMINKHEKLIYNQEYEIEEIRSKLHKLTHDDNNNESDDILKNAVMALRENLLATNQNILLLQRTIPLLKCGKSKAQHDLQTKESSFLKLNQKANDLRLECTVFEREKLLVKREREELEVDDTFSELFIQNRLQKLSELQQEISEIRTNRLDMEQCLKEEKTSLQGSLSATKTQIRELEAKHSYVIKNLHVMVTAVDQIKEKLNRIRQSINASEEEEEISPAHVIIKVAREREGLQEAGDLLDAEVRKAETEIESLQKILNLLSRESEEFRSKFHHVAYHNEEDNERLELEEKVESLERNIIIYNQLHDQESAALQNEKDYLRENELQLRAISELLHEKSIHIRAVDREIGNQLIKIRQVHLACKSLKQKIATKFLQLSDIELRVLQERLKSITSIIGEEATSQPEILDACVLYCQQENVPPPPKRGRLIYRKDFGSRSSLGSLTSYKENETKKSESNLEVARKKHLHSSMSSLHSQDSGSSSAVSSAIVDIPSLFTHRTAPDSDLHETIVDVNDLKKGKKVSIINGNTTSTQKQKGLKVIMPGIPKAKVGKDVFKGTKLLRRPSTHH